MPVNECDDENVSGEKDVRYDNIPSGESLKFSPKVVKTENQKLFKNLVKHLIESYDFDLKTSLNIVTMIFNGKSENKYYNYLKRAVSCVLPLHALYKNIKSFYDNPEEVRSISNVELIFGHTNNSTND